MIEARSPGIHDPNLVNIDELVAGADLFMRQAREPSARPRRSFVFAAPHVLKRLTNNRRIQKDAEQFKVPRSPKADCRLLDYSEVSSAEPRSKKRFATRGYASYPQSYPQHRE